MFCSILQLEIVESQIFRNMDPWKKAAAASTFPQSLNLPAMIIILEKDPNLLGVVQMANGMVHHQLVWVNVFNCSLFLLLPI